MEEQRGSETWQKNKRLELEGLLRQVVFFPLDSPDNLPPLPSVVRRCPWPSVGGSEDVRLCAKMGQLYPWSKRTLTILESVP